MSDDRGGRLGNTSPAERTLGVLGVVVALALLGFLGYQAATRNEPPQLEVVVTDVQETPGGFVTSVRVENRGGQTAEGTQVSGEITRDGTVVAQAQTTIAYVPPDSHRDATLVFDTDPRASGVQLNVGVSGYTPM